MSRRKSRSRSRSRSTKTYKAIRVPKGTKPGIAKRLVYDGHYKKTRGGLTKQDLKLNKYGKVVSKAQWEAGKQLQAKYNYEDNDEFLKYEGKIGKKSKSRSRSRKSRSRSRK